MQLLAVIQVALHLLLALGLEELAQSLMSSLADCSGVYAPVTAADAEASRQLLSLQALLEVASGPFAGHMGRSWVTVLKHVSALDKL